MKRKKRGERKIEEKKEAGEREREERGKRRKEREMEEASLSSRRKFRREREREGREDWRRRQGERFSLLFFFSIPVFSIFIKLFFSGFQFLKFSKDTKKSRKNVNSLDIKIYIILMNQCH